MQTLSKTFSANGASDIGTFKGSVHVHCSGTFGSGTLVVSFEGADGSFHDITGASYTAAGDSTIDLPSGVLTRLKGTLSGATAPSLYFEIRSA